MDFTNLAQSKMNKHNMSSLNKSQRHHNQHQMIQTSKITDGQTKHSHASNKSHHLNASTPLNLSFIQKDYSCCSKKTNSSDVINSYSPFKTSSFNKHQYSTPSNSRSYNACSSSCCSIEQHSSENRLCSNRIDNDFLSHQNHNHHRQSNILFNHHYYDRKNYHSHLMRSKNFDHSIYNDSSSSYIDIKQLTASSSDSVPPTDRFINIRNLPKSLLLDLLAEHDKKEQLENLHRNQQEHQRYFTHLIKNQYIYNDNNESILNESKPMFDYSSTPKPIINHTTMIIEGKLVNDKFYFLINLFVFLTLFSNK
jgi:hypothetical protein